MLPKVQRVRPKGPPFGVFRHSATFFDDFRISSKGTPCIFLKFSLCKKRLMGLNDLFLGFSALCDFNRILLKIYIFFFQMLPIVVFGLVRLFSLIFQMYSKGPPFIFYPVFPKNGCSKTPKCPLLHLSALCDLPRTKKNSKKISKKIIFFSIFSSRGFCRREYLTHWSPFAIFEP